MILIMIKKKQFFVTLIICFVPIVLLSAIASISSANSTSSTAQVQSVLLDDLDWQANPNVSGVESAIALGNPTNSELYVLFGKMAAGTEFPPHTHPDDRITTVISGVMYYGVGEQSDSNDIQSYPAGSVVYTPAGTSHYMWTKDGQTVMQETGRGPTGIEFTNASLNN